MAKILVIEDEKNQRDLYVQELKDEGYDVKSSDDGKEAVKMIQDGFRPDVVVLDIAMPKMDGITLLGKILAVDKKVPIIINTAYSNYKYNFMTWAAVEYVVKSGDLTELKTAIEKHLPVPATIEA